MDGFYEGVNGFATNTSNDNDTTWKRTLSPCTKDSRDEMEFARNEGRCSHWWKNQSDPRQVVSGVRSNPPCVSPLLWIGRCSPDNPKATIRSWEFLFFSVQYGESLRFTCLLNLIFAHRKCQILGFKNVLDHEGLI